ncbi:MAG TPA: hypothetical protein VM889_00610 [Candidatus Thermoplasmatota archaeon]|nr:hypothetical protein [Candidatus Thermoplasmatota archaeon]
MLKLSSGADFSRMLRQRGQTAVLFLPRGHGLDEVEAAVERAGDHADVHLAAAEIDPLSPLARQYRIGEEPTVILFENGRAQRRLDADKPDGFSEAAVRRFLR